jgi:putative intracellular protease/amidase
VSAVHAALLDYPTATSLQKIASKVWTRGGVVATVCHGPAIFGGEGIIDLDTKEHIIKGRSITGFTTEAEVVMGIEEELRGWKQELVEDIAKRVGATCKSIDHTLPSDSRAFPTLSHLLPFGAPFDPLQLAC